MVISAVILWFNFAPCISTHVLEILTLAHWPDNKKAPANYGGGCLI